MLDNCEHVLDGVSAFVELLIRSTSSLDVLLTSREGLGLAEEQQITVAPLPTDGAEAAAIELFVARASQIVDSFEIDETNVHDVIAICRRARRSSPRHRARRHASAHPRPQRRSASDSPTGYASSAEAAGALSVIRRCAARSSGRISC